jgi:MYXO-CTERM domain-containing protein
VRFKIVVEFLDGSSSVFPENRADPEYEFFAGEVEPLFCTDFSTNPFTEGWTHNLTAGTTAGRPDDWDWGIPMSPVASNDPTAAFSGVEVLGNDLGGPDEDGMYQPDVQVYAQTPIIDTGVNSDVRLQYWRWLSVEDGFFDQATIYGNGRVAWQNLNTDSGDQSNTHHLDREWRFHDVPLSAQVQGGKVQVKFEIDSDGGLEFGGWTIDDFCVVAANGAVCGDGELIGAETCDEGAGNSDSEPDACRTNCQLASCGDGVRDNGEACDDGNVADGDTCSADCAQSTGEETDCGCGVDSRGEGMPAGSFILLGLGALLLLRPRRRRRPR